MTHNGLSLSEYVESLLRLGQNRESEEFKRLIALYGLSKIETIAAECKNKIREQKIDQKRIASGERAEP